MYCCISGLEKHEVVLVLARTLYVMILDIEIRDIEYELAHKKFYLNWDTKRV